MAPLRDATNTRPRRLAEWAPHAKTQLCIAIVGTEIKMLGTRPAVMFVMRAGTGWVK